MAIEIERKFLLDSEAWRTAVESSRRMAQGYLGTTGGSASVRVRLDEREARLNIKAAVVATTRAEYDYPMPRGDAQEILDTLCVGRVDKTRHYLHHVGHLWEIDEFGGENAGLVVAEIELRDADETFGRPPWLGIEITEDERYYNQALALSPWRSWPENRGGIGAPAPTARK